MNKNQGIVFFILVIIGYDITKLNRNIRCVIITVNEFVHGIFQRENVMSRTTLDNLFSRCFR